MRSCWKKLGMVAAGLISMGEFLCSASAQYPPPGGGHGPVPGMPAMSGNPGHPPMDGYSLKDDHGPNAFNVAWPRLECLTWQLSLGYSILWLNGSDLPPVATTGSPTDPRAGALNQPNTSVLYEGPRSTGNASAFRTTFVCWLKDPEAFGLETNFFIMEQRSIIQGFSSDPNGNPFLARPYFDPNIGRENADQRAGPGILAGSMSDVMRTRLMGAEMNLKWCSSNNYEGCGLNLYCGPRWLRLDETYSNYDDSTLLGSGDNFIFSDKFTTYNQFFAGQVGAEFLYKAYHCQFSILTKVAVGPNLQTVKINGYSQVTDTNGNITIGQQGLYAQPTNVGTYNTVRVAVLPEVGANFRWFLSDRVHFNLGYSFFCLINTVRPGDQIDRRVNIQTLNAPVTPPFLPAAPGFHQSTLNAHMLNIGVEFLF